jgi:DNA-binding NarL/FixJ family response regulator
MIRVAIADDHRVLRVGLEQLLATFDDVELVGAGDGGEAAVSLCEAQTPDVLLLDLSMPDLDGIGVTRAVADASPATRVVIFTSFSDRDGIVAALDAGAVGYLLKDAEPGEILAAIRAAARGEAPLAPRAAAALLQARHDHRASAGAAAGDLTPRELDVLRLVIDGQANKQIARGLGISEKTVKGHLTNVFQRIGVTDRTQAALWAERTGIFRESGSRDEGPAGAVGVAGR